MNTVAMSTITGGNPLAARLHALLPGADGPLRERVLQALVEHVRLLMLESWTGLVERCAGRLDAGPSAPSATALVRSIASRMPEPDLLLLRLDPFVTPALLLALPSADRPALRAALLAHPRVHLREQTLDALRQGRHREDHPGDRADAALVRACAAWSRRMLIAELGHLPALCHTDRLALQDELLDGGTDAPRDEAEIYGLGEALAASANRRATAILAERAGVSLDVAEVAIALRDPKMLLALCWHAGCDAAEVVAVQVQLGRIPPNQVLRIGPGDGWPLDAVAMRWQIAILQDI